MTLWVKQVKWVPGRLKYLPKIIANKQFCWDLHESCPVKKAYPLSLASCAYIDWTLRIKDGLVKILGHEKSLRIREAADELLAGVP